MAAHHTTQCEDGFRGKTFLSSLWCVGAVMVAVVIVWNSDVGVNASTTTTNVTMVVEKTLLSGRCVDSSGSEVGDLAEWSTGCNRVVCHVEPSGNYTVTHGCRVLVPSENPDVTNCYLAQNTALAYPQCCPFLDCGSSSGISTVDPNLCVDLSSYSTCQIWKDLTTNCTNSTAFTYNFAVGFCQVTCGNCPAAAG